MTVTVSTEPTYLLPGKEAQVIASASSGNWVRCVITAAPEGSEWQRKLTDTDSAELQMFAVQSGIRKALTFDLAGKYVCSLREFTKGGVSFGGDYSEDPEGYRSETYVGTTSYSFTVGQRMTAPIALGNESGTVTFFIWDDTVRATTIPVHGEKSPRLEGNTPRMKTAAVDSTVATALAALEDQTASTIATDLGSIEDGIITTATAHMAASAFHGEADTANAIPDTYQNASTPEALQQTITTVNSKTRNHYLNATETGSGIGSKSFHTKGDWNNLPIVTGAADAMSAGVAIAAQWVSYEAHRLDLTAHTGSDTTNTLSALPPLLNLYRRIIDVVRTDNPSTPSVDNSGATLLVHRVGLTKA